MSAAPIRLERDEGELLWYDGGLIAFKATGRETDGKMLMFEAWMPGGKATPLHVHPESHETFYIIDGRIRVHVDGDEQDVSSGAVVMVPRGAQHAFAVASDSARLLVVFTPADDVSEAFFRAAGEPADSPTLPPRSEPDLERVVAAAHKTGLKVLGPPPFAAAKT